MAGRNNPTTNILIADIVLRGASTLLHRDVQGRVVKASAEPVDDEQDELDGRTIITTLGLYTASKLANRSVAGLGLVAGGLVLKVLHDRGIDRQRRLAAESENEGA